MARRQGQRGVGPGRSVASGPSVGAVGHRGAGLGWSGAARRRACLVGACDVGAVGRRCACGRSRGAADQTSGGGSIRAWLGSGEEEEEGPGRAQRLYKGEDL